MAIPNGWTEVRVDGDPKRYYEATIGEYVAKDKKTIIRVIAKTDTAGNFDLYELGPGASFPGGISGPYGDPTYRYNQSGSDLKYTGALPINKLNQITSDVKKRSYEINQAVGTDGEKEAIKNSKGYKSLSQTQSDGTDNQPGVSPTDSSLQSGSGAPSPPGGLPASTFGITVKDFQEDGKYDNSFLKYPISMNKGQDRIMFVQKRYVAPDILVNGKVNTDKIKAGNLSTDRFSDSKQDILGTVTLPMPNDISETNVTAWGEDSLSSLAALVGGAALSGVDELSSGNVPGTVDEIMNLIKTATGTGPASEIIQQLLTLNAAAAVTNKAGININAEAFRSRITGTAINPNLELLFQGPKLRSFGFQFKMIPRSEKEAERIRRIIKFFKKGMAPKRSKTAEAAYFLGAPNIFDIHFRAGEDESTGWDNDLASIGKIKTCALQQCLVNYTPDGFYAAFQDSKVRSQPIAVTMQLAFTELTPLYNDNYIIGDSVGWDNFGDIRTFTTPSGAE